jgi:hypothetical protein
MRIKRIISALAISFGLLLTVIGILNSHIWSVHARPLRDIGGSSVTPDHTDYYSGTSNVYSLTVHNESPDTEFLDEVKIIFPEGWAVTDTKKDQEDSNGEPVNFGTSGIKTNQITFSDNDGDEGEIRINRSWEVIVTVTAPITATGLQTVTWSLSGDEATGTSGPHDITDTFTLSPPQIVPLTDVTITGAYTGDAYAYHTFTSTVAPTTATQPIDYIWRATDQVSETHKDSGTSGTERFRWNSEGLKTVTVTASNAGGTISDTHRITITLPDVAPEQMQLNGPTAGLTDTVYTYTASVTPLTTTQPITYVWEGSDGFSRTIPNDLEQAVTVTWGTTGTKTITVTAINVAGAISETIKTQITTSSAPPTEVKVEGASVGLVDTGYSFITTAGPVTTTQPLSYIWQATNQEAVTHTGYLSDTAFFTWTQPGPQVITVTASNAADAVTKTHRIIIAHPLSSVTITGPVEGLDRTTYPFTATVSPSSTLQPITYAWQATERPPITNTSGLSDVAQFKWNTPGTKTITVTATNAVSLVSNTYTIALEASICLTVSPPELHFSAVESSTNPLPQNINIINCGNGELIWRLNSKLPFWLTITPTQGSNSSTITASVTISGLTMASYTDTIQFYGGDGVDQSTEEKISVRLRIGSGTVYLPLVIKNWPPTPGTPHLNAIEEPGANPSYLVDWDPASRADTYILEQATQSNFSDAEVIYDGEDTSYSVESEGIARYYYRVKAHNEFGDSGWSSTQSVTVHWEEEVNDNAETQANGPLASSSTYYGVFPADDPKDYFYFDLSSAHSVEVRLSNIATGEDYDVYLRDADLEEVSRSDETGSVDEHIQTGTLSPGRYYIHVYNYSASGSTQPYHLYVAYK